MGNKHIRGETSVEMKDVTAFKTASQVIADEMQEAGVMSYERAAEILNTYEHAFTVVKKHFPAAKCGTDILAKADEVLLKLGCTADNTLYAQSICPDEINHESGDITELFSKRMGEVFHMGGLGGIPFTGKTGFVAFSHHVPDDGNLFILFAPHIGISDAGELGKYSRAGQKDRCGTACGAACGALKFCEDCKLEVDRSTPIARRKSIVKKPGEVYGDYQMEFITSQINERLDDILSAPDEDSKQAKLARAMFEISKEFMNRNIHFDDTFAERGKPNLYLLGGIQINMPKPMPDFFMPLMFEERNANGTVTDLMESTFGPTKKEAWV